MYLKVKNKIFLFVYGTLRKEGVNNIYFLKKSKYLGTSYTLNKYLMIIKDKLPFLVDIPFTYIKGDLYEIDLQTLKNVDILEGHPDFYKRKTINVLNIENNKEILAETYFSNIKINETGDFKNQKLR